MKRISELCGVTKVTIYAHYRDKAHLYKAVMDGHLTSMSSGKLGTTEVVDLGDALMRIAAGIERLAADASCQAFCKSLSRSGPASDVYLERWSAILEPYLNLATQAMAKAPVPSTSSGDSEKFLRLILAERGLPPHRSTPMSGSDATIALFVRAYGARLQDGGKTPPA